MVLPNKDIVGKRFFKKKESYRQHAQVQKKVSKELSKHIVNHCNEASSLLEIGCGVGFLTRILLDTNIVHKYYVNDITPNIQKDIATVFEEAAFDWYEFISGDAEQISFPPHLQAIVSSSTLQWFHDVPSFFVKAYNSLEKDGILAFSTFGPQNFAEVRKITGYGLRYLTLAQLQSLLKPYFTIEFAQEWTEKIMFNTPLDVLKHIQATGVNSTNSAFFGKEHLRNFEKTYSRLFTENYQVPLTYHPIIIVAKKK